MPKQKETLQEKQQRLKSLITSYGDPENTFEDLMDVLDKVKTLLVDIDLEEKLVKKRKKGCSCDSQTLSFKDSTT